MRNLKQCAINVFAADAWKMWQAESGRHHVVGVLPAMELLIIVRWIYLKKIVVRTCKLNISKGIAMEMIQDGVEVYCLPDKAHCNKDEEKRNPLEFDECPIGCYICTGDCYYYAEN